MELKQMQELAAEYGIALKEEYRLRFNAQAEQEAADELEGIVVNAAYDSGAIDGKNKQIRDAQEAALIAESVEIKEARATVAEAQGKAETATAERKALEAEIGLTKAWLYSQAQIG